MNCPGSVAMEEGLPETSSPYAIEGDGAHALAEKCLRKGVDADVYVGSEVQVKGNHIEVTEEMAEAVQVFLDYVWGLVDDDRDELLIEEQFDLADLNPPGPMYGTSDAVVWKPKTRHLHVNDYKHGQGVTVDAEENSQLLYYALGVVVKLRKRPDLITVTIVQPRGFHPAGIVRKYTISFEDLIEFKHKLFAAAQATLEPDAPLRTGDWCRFCKAVATCPAQLETAQSVAMTAFDAEAPSGLPSPETLTDEKLAFVLARSKEVVDWFRAIERHVAERLERGEQFPGYKLVPKRATRKWTDEEAALASLSEEMGLPVEELYVKRFVSPAQAEKVLKAHYPKRARPDLPEDLIVKESSGFNLAPDFDPRPALPPAIDAFAVEEAPTTAQSTKPRKRKRQEKQTDE